jgi:hypothetical protein
MLQLVAKPTAVEPEAWFIVFHPVSATRWLNRLPMRFRHVSAFAYVHAAGCWLIYDVQFWGTRHILLPDNPAALDFLADFTARCTVLHMRRPGPSRLWFRVGFWCVPAIKHLLGLRSSALLPNGLYRSCLRAGAKVIHGPPEVRAPGRSESADAAGCGRTSQGGCASAPAEG